MKQLIMEALRSTVIKITYGGTGGKSLSLTEINDQINELLKAAVQSEGVISLFDSSKVAVKISACLIQLSWMKSLE